MRAVELFAGAGGLALGTSAAGFMHDAIIDVDPQTCRTVRTNASLGHMPIATWPVHEADVSQFDYSAINSGIDLLAGGPPCQPFSLGGKHRGQLDKRNMFPEAVRAVRELQPKAFLFENVKGLLRQSFSSYLSYINLQLTHPEVVQRTEESWEMHLERLEQHETSGRSQGLRYNILYRLLNSADYGVPQRRERVIIVGFRSDIDAQWSFPEATHSSDALMWSKLVTGDYWKRHGIRPDNGVNSVRGMPYDTIKSKCGLIPPTELPWLTVRDAISDLPDPQSPALSSISNHQYVGGARSYVGHTGSHWDDAAKTLKAGDHGVPGGENTLVLTNGQVRYFTLREAARLQTFPDNYTFSVSWTESMRQLGNAVPVRLAHVIAKSIHESLSRASIGSHA